MLPFCRSYAQQLGLETRRLLAAAKWRPLLVALVVAIAVTVASNTRADQDAPRDERPPVANPEEDASGEDETGGRGRTIGASPQAVDAQLAEAHEQVVDALFEAGPLEPLHDLWSVPTDWIREEFGLSLGLNYTMLYQHATRSRGTNDGFFGDLDLLGRWELADSDGRWPGAIAFHTEWRHRLAADTPGQLGKRIGSQWSTAVSSRSQSYAVIELYWEQGSVEDGLIVRAGKVDSALIYDGGRYVSQNLAFLSGAFSDSPAMSFPAAGLGIAAAAFPNDWLSVTVGMHDANARRTQVGFNSIDKTDFFYAGEIGITPGFGTEREGAYHITGWRSESASKLNQRSGEGFQIHAEQQLGPGGKIVPFVRYGWSSGGITGTKQYAAIGIGLEDPLGRRNDLVGFGFGWGAPKRSGRDQYTLEAFYRVRVTPTVSLTPDAQVILNPSEDRGRDTIWLFSLRARTVF